MSDPTNDQRNQEADVEVIKRQVDIQRKRIGGALILIISLVAIASLVLFRGDSGTALACSNHSTLLSALDEKATGDVAAMIIPKASKPLSELAFKAPDGSPLTVADFNGKTILLNLWATWCAPCREEMPMLDQLQARLGSNEFEVVAVNIDSKSTENAIAFLNEINVEQLAVYSDSSMKIFQDLRQKGRAFGMPTTVLIAEDGCELGTLSGPAVWDSEDAIALVQAALAAN